MKIRKLCVEHFRRFGHLELDLVDPLTDQARELVVIIGDNGSGKTSILQAAALCLGLATHRLRSLEDLEWPGFIPQRYASAWHPQPSRLTLEVEFSEDELAATRDFARSLSTLRQGPPRDAPGSEPRVTVVFEDGKLVQPHGALLSQLHGRNYLRRLVDHDAAYRDQFERVGGVFWYPQERSTSSLLFRYQAQSQRQHSEEERLENLRNLLATMRTFHMEIQHEARKLRPGQRDYWAQLSSAYQRVFAPRHLKSVELRDPGPGSAHSSNAWILFNDGARDYELAELSAGEKTLFPILYDFFYWNIHRSVLLIDEVELNLHPPLQQDLLHLLPRLGRDNQFLLTTHSNDLLRVVPPDSIVRVQGDFP